jgi:hypothetical protein
MTVGSATDTLNRLQSLVPSSWFKGGQPEEMALVAGIASSEAFVYALNAYAKNQTRLQTTTDGFLDLAAWDFFGVRFTRLPGETDAAFLARILLEIKRERATRHGIIQAVTDLTGITPIMIEPANPSDTWAWDISYWDINNLGSTQLNNQFFMTAYRPLGGGIANWPGWDFAYWDKSFYWADQSMVAAPVTDAQIYAAVAATVAAGVTGWVMIQNPPSTGDSVIFAQLRSGLPVDLGTVIVGASVSDSLGLVTGFLTALLDLGSAISVDSVILAQLRTGVPVDLGSVAVYATTLDDFGLVTDALTRILALGTAP